MSYKKALTLPTTVVLNEDGLVEKAWVGMWQEKEIIEARNYFGIDFSGFNSSQQ